MAKKSKVQIISKLSPEFSSNITVDNISYHVQTEDMGLKSCKIITTIYREGEVVYQKKSDYLHIAKLKNFKQKLGEMMQRQHKVAIDTFVSQQARKQKLKSEYFDEVNKLLRRRQEMSALTTLREALDRFPSDPFLLSYYGCMVALVEHNPKKGIKICIDAIKRLENSMPFGSEFFYPVFYLNLGRAYLTNNNKRKALQAFGEGLRHEPDNHDLIWELKKLGTRRKVPIPFLRRGNPINKYIGMLLGRSPQSG